MKNNEEQKEKKIEEKKIPKYIGQLSIKKEKNENKKEKEKQNKN